MDLTLTKLYNLLTDKLQELEDVIKQAESFFSSGAGGNVVDCEQ